MSDKKVRKWLRDELMPWIEGQSGVSTQDDGPGGQNPPPPPPPPPVGGGDDGPDGG